MTFHLEKHLSKKSELKIEKVLFLIGIIQVRKQKAGKLILTPVRCSKRTMKIATTPLTNSPAVGDYVALDEIDRTIDQTGQLPPDIIIMK